MGKVEPERGNLPAWGYRAVAGTSLEPVSKDSACQDSNADRPGGVKVGRSCTTAGAQRPDEGFGSLS